MAAPDTLVTERFDFTVTVVMDAESNLLFINVRCPLCADRVVFNPHELWQHACKHPKDGVAVAGRDALVEVVRSMLNDGEPAQDPPLSERIVDALFTDENFNDIIRVLGGKVAGFDKRMRVEWGSSVLFKQGGDLYD